MKTLLCNETLFQILPTLHVCFQAYHHDTLENCTLKSYSAQTFHAVKPSLLEITKKKS